MSQKEQFLAVEASRELRKSLSSIRTDDPKLCSFLGLPIMPHGFFPGGHGLYNGLESRFKIPATTLVLGSNFGCIGEFINGQGKLLVQDERGNQTWKPLLKLLRGSGVVIDECFFTNAWPFLHEGDGNLTKGLIKSWLGDRTLMASCLQFFRLTFVKMKPNLVVALGAGPAAFLSHMWPDQLNKWHGCSLGCLDDLPKGEVEFEHHRAVCVGVSHPSMPNAWRRRPPYQHLDGETRLVKEARLQAEGLSSGTRR
jgi:hypothetical protein